MLEKFKTIKFNTMPSHAQCVEPDRGHKELTLQDPAISVMTDYRIKKAPLCHFQYSIDKAMKQMAEENCKMLLVIDDEQQVIGLITSADITGEKPIQYISKTSKPRNEIQVRHLMNNIKDIPALSIKDVLDSQIGDVLHTLNEIGSEYVMVIMDENKQAIIRGVFSAKSIARALKIFFEPNPGARTFAEFTKALHGSVLTH